MVGENCDVTFTEFPANLRKLNHLKVPRNDRRSSSYQIAPLFPLLLLAYNVGSAGILLGSVPAYS